MKTDMPARIRTVVLLFILLVIGCGSASTDRAPVAAPRGPARVVETAQPAGAFALTMPNRTDSVKFAVLGDFGTGRREEYDLAAVIKRVHDQHPFDRVILVGDNLYGS